jgi:hypothetical protein
MQKLLRKAAQTLYESGKMGKDEHHNYFMSGKSREPQTQKIKNPMKSLNL